MLTEAQYFSQVVLYHFIYLFIYTFNKNSLLKNI